MKRIRSRTDSGLTLVELMVYSILMIVVIGLAGALFIRLLNEQRDITAMAEAENSLQLLYKQLETDIRNADWAEVDGGGDLLVLRTGASTAVDSTSVLCVGYYFDQTTGTMYRTQTAGSTSTKAALDALDDAGRKNKTSAWNVSMRDVEQIGSAAVFGPRDALFGEYETISISLGANAVSDRKPVEFEKSVSLRPQADMGAGCR